MLLKKNKNKKEIKIYKKTLCYHNHCISVPILSENFLQSLPPRLKRRIENVFLMIEKRKRAENNNFNLVYYSTVYRSKRPLFVN